MLPIQGIRCNFVYDGEPLNYQFSIWPEFLDENKNPIPNIRPLASYYANNDEEIDYYHDNFVYSGYEGLIIHKIKGSNGGVDEMKESVYKPGRSKNLLKYKRFDDEEATIIGINEGSGREKGLAVFLMLNFSGVEYSTRPSAKFEFREEIFSHPEKYLGRVGTIKYFGKSEYGIPRFPVFTKFRDEII